MIPPLSRISSSGAAACQSAEARKLASYSDGLKEVYEKPATLERKDKSFTVRAPTELLDLILAVLGQVGPAAVIVSVWTIGIRDAQVLAHLLDSGQIARECGRREPVPPQS